MRNLHIDVARRDWDPRARRKFLSDAKGHASFIKRLSQTPVEIRGHRGCVNTLCWNATGTHLLSGSDDRRFLITRVDATSATYYVEQDIQSTHMHNIFAARFLPAWDMSHIVSCSAEGLVGYTTVERKAMQQFQCHTELVYDVHVMPASAATFLSCSGDGTVREFDVRQATSCECGGDDEHHVLINTTRLRPSMAVTAISTNPLQPYYLATACSDGYVRIYDRRSTTEQCVSMFAPDAVLSNDVSDEHRMTALEYDSTGTELLLSYSDHDLFLFNVDSTGTRTTDAFGSSSDDSISNSDGEDAEQADVARRRARLERAAQAEEHARDEEQLQREREHQEHQERQHPLDALTTRLREHRRRDNETETMSADEAASIIQRSVRRLIARRRHHSGIVPKLIGRYTGHVNSRTMIKEATFFGRDHVMSGSDHGQIFIWNKTTRRIVQFVNGDGQVVNCLAVHPTLPVLACSGIDDSAKLFRPLESAPTTLSGLHELTTTNREERSARSHYRLERLLASRPDLFLEMVRQMFGQRGVRVMTGRDDDDQEDDDHDEENVADTL